MLTPDVLLRNHHAIGQRLLAAFDAARPEEWVFLVADHFNKAGAQVSDTAERLRVAELNAVAAREAQRAAAYGIALDYLDNVSAHLGANPWDTHYALMRQASLERIDNHYLLGNADAADRDIEDTLRRSRTATEQPEVQVRRVRCMMALSQYPNALKAGVEALQLLNFQVPQNPTPAQVRGARWHIEWARRGRPIEQLADAPMMQAPHMVRILEALSSIVVPAFFANTPLLHFVVLSMGRVTIQYGNSPYSVYAFASLSLIYSQMNRLETSRYYAMAARNALQRIHGAAYAASSLYFTNAFIEFARTMPRPQAELFDDLYDRTIEGGDPLFAGL